LQFLTSDIDLDAFFDHVRVADHRLLLLDYDGTLAPFNVDRAKAVLYPAVKKVLPDLLRLPNSRTVIVSGRPVADLVALIGVKPSPEIWGSHGWEHLSSNGKYFLPPLDQASRAALQRASEVLDTLNLPNLREDKPVSVAAHWRGLPADEVNEIHQYIEKAWTGLLSCAPLEKLEFDGGLELRVKGRGKGWVVEEILRKLDGDTAAAFLGDDKTDEEAFGIMAGKGLRVLVRPVLRTTLADLWLQPPDEVIEFLTNWMNACSAEPTHR
jgi:trehalose 6-phosphate phosphatase